MFASSGRAQLACEVIGPKDGWSAVSDTLAVLDAAGCDRSVLVACSMGGQTAIDLTLAHPERVAGLLLIGRRALPRDR